MHKTFTALITITVVGCTYPPSSRELSDKYLNNPMLFEELGEMIQEDAGSQKCFEVSMKRIGHYEQDVNGRWSSIYNRGNALDFAQVLSAVSLSRARHEDYIRKLASLGARGISYCKGLESGSWVSVLISHSGFCQSAINWNEKLQAPHVVEEGGDFHEITSLRNGWYAEVSCS